MGANETFLSAACCGRVDEGVVERSEAVGGSGGEAGESTRVETGVGVFGRVGGCDLTALSLL